MEGKLIKEDKEYYLEDKLGVTIASTDKILLKETDTVKKLSRRNCEEIEFGFSLVELFDKVDSSIDYHEFDFCSFRLGVKAVLELLGDKKFSEDDIYNTLDFARGSGKYRYEIMSDDNFIQSLQQTEWDIEIELECCSNYSSCNWNCEHGPKPKLDVDGCLILKRK